MVLHSTLTSEVGGSNLEPYVGRWQFLPMVGSLQYRTLTNCMYWFPLQRILPAVIMHMAYTMLKASLNPKYKINKYKSSTRIRITLVQ